MSDLFEKWNTSWDAETIRLIEVNGAWYAADDGSRDLLEFCGLNPDGAFLSYDLLLNHVGVFGFCVETDAT